MYRKTFCRLLSASSIGVTAMLGTPHANADAVAYLFNVKVRPGYNFANSDDALD